MKHNIYFYLLVMASVIYLIRVLPLTFLRKPIRNRTIRSFLHYVPYVTLAVMTFPAILYSTNLIWSALAALLVAAVLAWSGRKLFTVSLAACVTVLVVELLSDAVGFF